MRVKKTRKVDIVIVCVLAALLALAVVLTLIPSAKQREVAQKATGYEAFIGKKLTKRADFTFDGENRIVIVF